MLVSFTLLCCESVRVCVVVQASSTRVMLGGRLVGQCFLAEEVEEEVRGESHMAPSLLQGVWTSCRAAPCQELSGDGRKKGKRGKGRNTDKREVVCSGARGRRPG